MTNLAILPVRNEIPPVIQIYDLLVVQEGCLLSRRILLQKLADTKVVLYGKEINDETYAICKSDMIIGG